MADDAKVEMKIDLCFRCCPEVIKDLLESTVGQLSAVVVALAFDSEVAAVVAVDRLLIGSPSMKAFLCVEIVLVVLWWLQFRPR